MTLISIGVERRWWRSGFPASANCAQGIKAVSGREEKNMTFLKSVGVALAMTAVATVGHAQVIDKKALTLDAAKKVAAAAEADAKAKQARVVIAVVDDGGNLLLLERLDDTQVASVNVGIGKARTAAIFRRPSKVFEDQIREGRVAALALPGATPLQGGIPIVVDGRVIGAIGVSGETPGQDEDIAKVGAEVAKQWSSK